MLFFSASVKVLQDCHEQRDINGYKFNVFRVQASNVEIYAFFDDRFEVREGDLIMSDSVYLTNYQQTKNPVDVALRFGKFTIVEEKDFSMPDVLEVIVNGKLVKSSKAKAKLVGVTRYPSIATTLSIRNELNKTFDMLLLATHKRAEAIEAMGPNTYISCTAKLYRKSDDDIYKLILVDYTDCSPAKAVTV